MPTYCYRTDDGIPLEHIFPMGQAPETFVTDDNLTAHRDREREWKDYSGHVKVSDSPARIYKARVVTSEAMGVMPDQVTEAQSKADALGLKVHYRPDGIAEFGSQKDKDNLAKHFGYVYRS